MTKPDGRSAMPRRRRGGRRDPRPAYPEPSDEVQYIGYLHDGVFWVTVGPGVSTPADAEAAASQWSGWSTWRVEEEVWLAPTGDMVNNKEYAWEEAHEGAHLAKRGWRLIDTAAPTILVDGELYENPQYEP